MIEVKNLTKTYKIGKDIIKAVDNVSLNVQDGEFLTILGHSGSGKTTLLSLIGGLTKPDSGTVIIDGTDIWAISDNELSEFRNRKMNFIYQFASLIPTLNVIENVLLPTVFSTEKQEGAYEYALELLKTLGIAEKIHSYPSQLSGGQQRRVAIARAFINRPEIILADEPTGDLDEETEAEVMSFFHKMNREHKITFLMVTHNTYLTKGADTVYRMSQGVLTKYEEKKE